jgi:NTP pyrophosphatase (non-canonical NTP hydrolase)
MTFTQFQQAALRTSQAEPHRERLMVQALGLAGEAAEVGQLIKKWAWHGKPLDAEKIKDELSDTLWYIADLASALNLNLDEIAAHNVNKLLKRYPSGFTADGGQR